MERLALDIETVSPDVPPGRKPNFEDSRDFELLAVALGYADGDDVEETVVFREGNDAASEIACIRRVCEWCRERIDGEATLLTYNGDRFDLPHLRGRARLAGQRVEDENGIVATLEALLDGAAHRDLKTPAWDAFGPYTRLEEACRSLDIDVSETRWAAYDHGIDPGAWRSPDDAGCETVRSSDVPHFGESYLNLRAVEADTDPVAELRAMLEDYALADVRPLFALDDARPFE